jgi:hypothetical protein
VGPAAKEQDERNKRNKRRNKTVYLRRGAKRYLVVNSGAKKTVYSPWVGAERRRAER